MADKNSSSDYEKLIRAFDELFEELLMQDSDEADNILREAGYDPQEVGAAMEAVAKRALESSPLNWKVRAKTEIEKAQSQLGSFSSAVQRSRKEMIEAITRLIAQQPGRVEAHFRNIDSLTDTDLEHMLTELEYLDSQRTQRANRNDKE